MDFENYLKTYQPIAYSTFLHALENNKIAHAYLIKGNDGAPLLECAMFFAKSLLCNEGLFACDKCMNCIRFDEGNYADFILLDGSKSNIKVDDIDTLQNFFSKTSSEKSNKMIYIINQLENSNVQSLNAILKFLEEPNENVYAFITTYNEERLLPTILSRTQHIKLLPLATNKIVEEAITRGISQDDSELLANFYTNVDSLISIASAKEYTKIKDLAFDTLAKLENKEEALFFVETVVSKEIKAKQDLRLYLDILSLAFKDVMNYKLNLNISLKSHESLLSKLAKSLINPDKIYLETILVRGQIELNVNQSLLLEHLFIYILQGGN